MTWRVPPYDRAVDEAVTYVRAKYSAIGVIIAGSIVRGEAGPTSDLDVVVVHEQPWRVRDQQRFAGVPAEVFVNPPAQIRRYFETEHGEGCPTMAHMIATGEAIEPVHDTLAALVAEARQWLARPVEISESQLEQRRYGIVDRLDDARDIITKDPAMASVLLASVVHELIGYSFWKQRTFQPRRKDAVAALATLDPDAATLVRAWSTAAGHEALVLVEHLARHVLGVDGFFPWTSERDPVATD